MVDIPVRFCQKPVTENTIYTNEGGIDTALANHKSALKRVKQNEHRRLRNKIARTRIKSVVKDVDTSVEAQEQEAVSKNLRTAQSVIDRGSKKGAIHRNTASRKISRLARRINSATQ